MSETQIPEPEKVDAPTPEPEQEPSHEAAPDAPERAPEHEDEGGRHERHDDEPDGS